MLRVDVYQVPGTDGGVRSVAEPEREQLRDADAYFSSV